MSAHSLARISNHFAPSSRSLALDDLLSTVEGAALLGVKPDTLRWRARRLGVEGWRGKGNRRYWTRRQIDRLRGRS